MLIKILWQLKTVDFLHWCLMPALLLEQHKAQYSIADGYYLFKILHLKDIVKVIWCVVSVILYPKHFGRLKIEL